MRVAPSCRQCDDHYDGPGRRGAGGEPSSKSARHGRVRCTSVRWFDERARAHTHKHFTPFFSFTRSRSLSLVPPPTSQSSSKGRRRVAIEFLEDKAKRHITFSKRKQGIMKKVGGRDGRSPRGDGAAHVAMRLRTGVRVEHPDRDANLALGRIRARCVATARPPVRSPARPPAHQLHLQATSTLSPRTSSSQSLPSPRARI